MLRVRTTTQNRRGTDCRERQFEGYCSRCRDSQCACFLRASSRTVGPVMRQSLEPSRVTSDYHFLHQVRARFAETDAMGIIHHAAYLPYLEEARVAYLRHLGHPYDAVRRDGLNFAVLEVSVQYRRPLAFDDLIDVHLRAGAVSGATFQLAYLLAVGGERRATAVTVHGCVDGAGRPTRLPAWVDQAFGGGQSAP
jgi:acyl-CoA thioester hydrolase